MIDLKANPFFLDDAGIQWVQETRENMTVDEKIGQLFCPIGMSPERGYLQEHLLDRHVGGVLFRNGDSREMQGVHNFLQKGTKIPLLIAANLEAGGDGIAVDGTAFGKQMEMAATGDPESAYELGKVSCSEGKAVGCNWAFAPVVDIDRNFRNPITNVRTYGDDPDRVISFARAYLRAAKEEGVATAVKHFPGDGIDERDQHLLTSVNSLSCEEWDKTYGRIYQNMIEAGTLTVMIGHIAMPAWQEKLDPDYRKNELLPASLSSGLLNGLLRGRLGFNGLIVSDATPMVGFCAAMPREKAVPLSIERGIDMFLFNKDLDEDIAFMKRGLENGLLSEERLNEAVTRILATKAALGLPQQWAENQLQHHEKELEILRCPEHEAWADSCADRSITLVKDTQHLLPISPVQHHRVLLEILGHFPSNDRVRATIHREMEQAGFEVIDYVPEDFGVPLDDVAAIRRKYDLVLYVGNIENASNQTVSRIQ